MRHHALLNTRGFEVSFDCDGGLGHLCLGSQGAERGMQMMTNGAEQEVGMWGRVPEEPAQRQWYGKGVGR